MTITSIKNTFMILNVNENTEYFYNFTNMRFTSDSLLFSTLGTVCPSYSIIFYDRENTMLTEISVSNAYGALCYSKLCESGVSCISSPWSEPWRCYRDGGESNVKFVARKGWILYSRTWATKCSPNEVSTGWNQCAHVK